jgi:hypothetical protein
MSRSPTLALRRYHIYVKYALMDQLGYQTDGFGTEATKHTDAANGALGYIPFRGRDSIRLLTLSNTLEFRLALKILWVHS